LKVEAGLPLTVCVTEVAASGGYLMACVAHHICVSPLAALGSIGVVTSAPNVYERLQREGVNYQIITAGKYKRTLTPTSPVTEEDVAKTKEDLEAIYTLFKDFVGRHRPSLDIASVATGEVNKRF
jgi:ClpP class serine protease